MNSERHVRALLPDGVSLLSPSVNCESSRQVAAGIEEWAPATPKDLVHINCGLHDLRHDPGLDRPVCTLTEYERNLDSIFGFLFSRGARVIWATSTPFLEQVHNSHKQSRRFLRHLIEYNDASRTLAARYGFTINDLHAKLSDADLGELLLPDGLHFNTQGNKLVGALIAASINAELAPNNSSKPTPLRGAA
ncbi:SGNH/GDSL hydrolase family protein [Vulcaniibacterium thermophilum]|uniref:SGNH/GDSL hydrolase family protein n=1 Tax=Vulcaniibacterium thermophilum TaxID=1169913 RepID=UPI0011B589D0|nr:SGNH/GDSL hydrolase family protein [Vulcaniibacterium thermophilum]